MAEPGQRRDRELGVLQRLRVTPAPNWMIMASRLIVQVAVNLIADSLQSVLSE